MALRRVDETARLGRGQSAAVAHLLSELIENGLTFSPPDSEVEVSGRQLGDGYLIAVIDQGIGMTHRRPRGGQRPAARRGRLHRGPDAVPRPLRRRPASPSRPGCTVELLPSPVTGCHRPRSTSRPRCSAAPRPDRGPGRSSARRSPRTGCPDSTPRSVPVTWRPPHRRPSTSTARPRAARGPRPRRDPPRRPRPGRTRRRRPGPGATTDRSRGTSGDGGGGARTPSDAAGTRRAGPIAEPGGRSPSAGLAAVDRPGPGPAARRASSTSLRPAAARRPRPRLTQPPRRAGRPPRCARPMPAGAHLTAPDRRSPGPRHAPWAPTRRGRRPPGPAATPSPVSRACAAVDRAPDDAGPAHPQRAARACARAAPGTRRRRLRRRRPGRPRRRGALGTGRCLAAAGRAAGPAGAGGGVGPGPAREPVLGAAVRDAARRSTTRRRTARRAASATAGRAQAPAGRRHPDGGEVMTIGAHADQQFGWLLGNFVRETDGVREAVAVSSDGLLIAGLRRAGARRRRPPRGHRVEPGEPGAQRVAALRLPEALEAHHDRDDAGVPPRLGHRRRQLPRCRRRGGRRRRPHRLRDRLARQAVRPAADARR